jgi:FKBP-type peptidyl-prolyl cis-trans isomerase
MKFTTFKIYTILSLVILTIVSCDKEFGTIEELDNNNIQAYIKQNNLDVQQFNNTGIYYKILSAPTGPALAYNQEVPIVFTIHSVDGKYESLDTLFTNRFASYLGYLGPEGFKIGAKDILKNSRGKIRLIIPSRLAYGRNGNSKIPGNASLDVTLEVLDKEGLPNYEDGVIKQFFQTNSLTGFSKTSSGLYYKITDAGTGASVTPESQITINYTGKLLDGRTFDFNNDIALYLDDLIAGWKEGLLLIKSGGSIRLIIPSSLAYGFKSNQNIPPFSTLDFEIKLTKVAP